MGICCLPSFNKGGWVYQTCKHLSFVYSERQFVFPVRENFVSWCFSQKLQKLFSVTPFTFFWIEIEFPGPIQLQTHSSKALISVFFLLKLLQWSPGYPCGGTRPGVCRARGGDKQTWRGILSTTPVMLLPEITRPPVQKLKCHFPLWK